jgi:excisionase family DNA binding protein
MKRAVRLGTFDLYGEAIDRSGGASQKDRAGAPPGPVKNAALAVPQSDWMDTYGAAAYLGVKVEVIRQACARREMQHVRLGAKTIRLKQVWVDEWCERHLREPV